MNNITRDYRNDDGTVDMIVISSNDKYRVNLNGGYKLANKYVSKKTLGNMFKDSILGVDIGINSNGFASITMLSFAIAITVFVVLCKLFRI